MGRAYPKALALPARIPRAQAVRSLAFTAPNSAAPKPPMPKNCFMDKARPCDLTCKAAFEVDDPVDNIDCYLIWMVHHFGEGFFNIGRSITGGMPSPFQDPGAGSGDGPAAGGPQKPKGFPNN